MDNQNFNNSFNNQNKNYDLLHGYGNANQYNQPNQDNQEFQPNNHFNTYQYNYNQNNYDKGTVMSSSPPKKKLRYGKVITFFGFFLIIAAIVSLCVFMYNNQGKTRTFMIYMVGSDLESNSKQGTFSISDVVSGNINLSSNNVLLMVGGAKIWHNFVSNEEIGIYKLTSEGFKKIDSLPVSSMGSDETLEKFLNYSYDNFKSKYYDLIFWNHGLGAMGIEQDELSNDYITLQEMDTAFKNSRFSNEKLEMTIFYNCLASNLHIANVMKNYSNYMVASEEVFYLSKVLNRLNFIGNVKVYDTAYDVGYKFIEQSDSVMDSYNKNHTTKLDSTLSIIDLSKIDNLNNKLNTFISSINLMDNYYSISSMRRKAHTYGKSQTTDYDTIDLYSFVESMGSITKTDVNDVLQSIDDAIMYTSNLNEYSNGISIYFPYFGSNKIINMHLNLFKKLWNDNYYQFINNFYEIRTGTIRARRDLSGSYNKLSNNIEKDNNSLTIELTGEEKELFESANIYLFKKENDDFNLILESDNVELVDNKLVFYNNKLLTVNGEIFTLVFNEDNKYSYGRLSNSDINTDSIFYIENNEIIKTLLDSSVISNSLIDYLDYDNIEFSKVKYNMLEDGEFNEYFKDTQEKEYISVSKDDLNISITDNLEDEYYVLFEMNDIYNDSYYSMLEKIG